MQVAGFRRWLELGRHVRRGQKGFAILAPVVTRHKVEDQDTGEERTLDARAHGSLMPKQAAEVTGIDYNGAKGRAIAHGAGWAGGRETRFALPSATAVAA